MDNRNDIDLRGAIPPTPDMCREAVRQAVSTYREERNMKKTYRVLLAAVLVLMLLCGTAFAIANYYSVREYVALGKTSTAFEEAIVPLEKSVTVQGVTISLGDAVFDGRELSLTMNLEAEEGAESLYILPRVEAFAGDRMLPMGGDSKSQGFDAYSGLLYPYMEASHGRSREYGKTDCFGITVEAGDAGDADEVTWRCTMHVFRPVGKLVDVEDWEVHPAWTEYLRRLHAKGEIGVWAGYSLADYLDAVGVCGTGDMRIDTTLETGMFEALSSIVFEFTTPVPQWEHYDMEEVFRFDGYEVVVQSVVTGLLQVDYELEVRFDEAYEGHEHDLGFFYLLSDQDGEWMLNHSATLNLWDDRMGCSVRGSVQRISDAPLTALTFTMKPRNILNPNERNAALASMPSFTVALPQ